MRARTQDRERGSVTLELAILAPALILVLGLLVLGGRVEVAASAVEQATAAAARAASLERSVAAAQIAAESAVDRETAARDIRCVTTTVEVDASGLTAPLGTSATVTVRASCTVTMADLAVPGLPGTRTITAEATSAVDRFRTR
ncbi:TadE/TadG family type IV pilus assembly protein [Cellulomonas sp. C5510]|uniref:TadE/TadG family type IV pilus assembly protein n=1 Tax=Cellulomonas sp. C5510 TaxID=2871170 RepID=UPI001C938CAD|nr:TadE/TadG family type IV pilus assembly protein [Cellulomonas sp. C5510]QZN84910.1 pilus assembly protein [Cellulomonas sp. C5510]